jgi:RNA polymerase sigma-70 factor (ECF subfamily)
MPDRKTKTEKAVAEYSRLVYGIALTQLSFKAEADDVFQEVFLTYFNKDVDFSDSEHEKAWLIRTTVNFCKKSNFNPWRMRTVSLEEKHGGEVFGCETEEETRVFEALKKLKPKYKIPMYLHYFENMPIEKIAAVLGIKKDAVKKQLQRGRQQMKERLECDYFE